MFQLFVGEIGIPRKEFLNELVWWELKSILRGYHARHHAGWEQARWIAYESHYCMGSKDPVPRVNDWIKFPWEKEPTTRLSEDEIMSMQAEMAAYNEQLKEQRQ